MSTNNGSGPRAPKTAAEVRAYKRSFSRGFVAGQERKAIPFSEGWRSLPGKVKVTYVVIAVFSLAYHISSYFSLPSSVSIGMYFGWASVSMNTILFLNLAFGFLLALIFFDITNRSVSKVRLFIPMLYFAAEMYLISDLIAAST